MMYIDPHAHMISRTTDDYEAIGEIGYDEQTELEDRYFRAQLELSKELELPVLVVRQPDNLGF